MTYKINAIFNEVLMKHTHVLGIFLLLFFGYAQDVSASIDTHDILTEERSLELLITAQEQSIQKLRLLIQSLKQFREQELLALKDSENLDVLYKLSESAATVKKIIHECYVEPYFRPQFLEDIEKLSKAAENKNPPLLTQ